jgi:hypothetical protein
VANPLHHPRGPGFPRVAGASCGLLFERAARLAEIEAVVRREFPGGLARWEVRPFSDGRRPVEASREDRFARLQNIKTGAPNALLDPAPGPGAAARRFDLAPRPVGLTIERSSSRFSLERL